ncbi:RHS repeat-associated core domain-containing protein [Sorangium sp. So ce185]|uniref:RHS repeat domain-containing protein n=1 Tax=Sorangium sp. So ce185 TaxID=3133287 RepID=UPI003F610E18
MRKEFDGSATEYVWDGDDLVHERVRRADGTLEPLVTWIFEPGAFAPVAKFEGRKRYSVVTDHLGTPTMLMTEEGQAAWKAQLDLYGVPREDLAAKRAECPWRYPGQYEDPETGLYYNRFRYYDPESGRYISQDLICSYWALNAYRYVNSPVSVRDVYGLLDPWDIRFTQPTISSTFRDGPWAERTLEEAIDEARRLGRLPEGLELNVIKINDDFFTLNNRTLYVAQQANLLQVHPKVAGPKGINLFNKLIKDGGPLELGEQPKVCG